jgi:hypothetical protein
MRGEELLAWIESLPSEARDAMVEERLGLSIDAVSSASPGDHLVGHYASGVDAIVRAVREAPIGRDDVFVDLGAGLGKVVLLVHLLTGARARGIEIQPELVESARESAARLGADVTFDVGDVREADISDASVLYLYSPFDGLVLAEIAARMKPPVTVCALAVELDRHAPWLERQRTDSFWLTIYRGVKRTE